MLKCDNDLDQIRKDAPPMATHYDYKQQIYIAIDNACFYFLNGDWIQYDDSCRMQLTEI